MKAFMIALLTLIGSQSAAAAAECTDFSGTYAHKQDEEVFQRQWTYVQSGCDKLTVFGRWSNPDGTSYVSMPNVVELDGELRRRCESCLEAMYKIEGDKLLSVIKNVNSEKCDEKHTITLDSQGNKVDRWGFYCPQGNHEFRSIEYRKPDKVLGTITVDVEFKTSAQGSETKLNAWNANVPLRSGNPWFVPLVALHDDVSQKLASLDQTKKHRCKVKAERIQNVRVQGLLVHQLESCSAL